MRKAYVAGMIPLSVLDLAPIVEGGGAAGALAEARRLAQHAEALGYRRYWVAEHHNMPGIASAATAVVIAHIAAATKTIRVGAGGIMLPNHAPLVIAEQFGTLEALFPGRIDLGLGRAPGTDQATAHALRRTLVGEIDRFPNDVLELQALLGPPEPGQRVRAIPGAGSNVPIWILGSSLYGAQLAALFGLPFAFASHFAPAQLLEALALYRANFKPSAYCAQPTVMAALAVVAAETDEEALFLATSQTQAFLNLRRGAPTPLPPPRNVTLSAAETAGLEQVRRYAAVGGPDLVRTRMRAFAALTGADELIITAQIFDAEKRLRSFELVAELMASASSH